MDIVRTAAGWALRHRLKRLDEIRRHAEQLQQKVFSNLMDAGRNTHYGKQHGFSHIRNQKDFSAAVPLVTYEEIQPWIERVLRGEANVLWPGVTKWFSKSSGTTNDRSKYIPVTPEALRDCHYRGGQDMVACYLDSRPDTGLFKGKQLSLGGSLVPNQQQRDSWIGDVSAVLLQNLPLFYEWMRTPSKEISLLSEWEEKIERIAAAVLDERVSSASGVPTWMLVLFRRVLEMSGKKNLSEAWPDFEVFFHGGVSFTPYREIFRTLFPDPSVRFFETYNASEGFFSFQDDPALTEMLLLADHGVYFEFIPLDDFHSGKREAVPISGIEAGKQYAIVISTNAGLWRYLPGDTIRVASVNPPRVFVSGRTRNFINAFGEELMVENAEEAMLEASRATGAIVENYSAAPLFFSEEENGAHEWLIEFSHPPENLNLFSQRLDEKLKSLNSDYDAKRYKDMALRPPVLRMAPVGFFQDWLKENKRLGSQAKIPRLSNDRELMDRMLRFLEARKT